MDTREEFNELAAVYLPVGIAVAVIVFGLVGFALIRYRRRDEKLPGQRLGLPRVETGYALALAVIAATLLFFSFRATDDIDRLDADPGLRIDVTGFQWNWRFSYPDDGVTVIGTDERTAVLMVPADTTVRFSLTSRDVIHSFWIPEVRFKRDAFPQRDTEFDLVFDEVGGSTGRCAEFCGLAHSRMTFDVVVMEPDEFEDWLATRREA